MKHLPAFHFRKPGSGQRPGGVKSEVTPSLEGQAPEEFCCPLYFVKPRQNLAVKSHLIPLVSASLL